MTVLYLIRVEGDVLVPPSTRSLPSSVPRTWPVALAHLRLCNADKEVLFLVLFAGGAAALWSPSGQSARQSPWPLYLTEQARSQPTVRRAGGSKISGRTYPADTFTGVSILNVRRSGTRRISREILGRRFTMSLPITFLIF